MSDFGRRQGMSMGRKKEPWERERRAGKDLFKDYPDQERGVRLPKSSESSQDPSVGTAGPSGPSYSDTSREETEYQPQSASTYAAADQEPQYLKPKRTPTPPTSTYAAAGQDPQYLKPERTPTPPASTYAAAGQDPEYLKPKRTPTPSVSTYAVTGRDPQYLKPERRSPKNVGAAVPSGPPSGILPTPEGRNETEELRMETRQRTQIAKGVSPMELTRKELVGQARTYEPTVEDLTRRQELLEEELDRIKKRQMPPAVLQGALQGQKVTAKDLREQEMYLENQLGQIETQIRDKKLADWYSIPGRSDYAEHSQAGESKRGEGFWSSGDDLYDFINDIPRDGMGYRKWVEAMSAGTGQSETYGGYSVYTYLVPEEIGIYNYLYDTEGKEAADEFLEAIKESLNYRMGKENFENISEVGKGIYWLPQGVDRFTQGLLQRFDRKVIPTSPTQYTGGMIRQEIRDMGGIPAGVLGAAYDVGTAGSGVLPGVLAAWLLKAYHVPATTAAAAGNGLTTTAMMGNAYKAKRDEGWSENQAESYAKLMGAGAMASQQVLGAIGAFSGGSGLSDKAIQAVLPKISHVENGCVRFLLDVGARVGIRGTAGGGMAALQRLMDPLYNSVIRGEEYSVDLEDVTYAYLVGGMTSGLFEIPNALRAAQAQVGLSPYVFRIKGYMGKENVDYFSECTSLEEVQAQYGSLVEQYYPDMGGDAGILATINAQYDLQRGYYRGKAAGEAALALQSPKGTPKGPEGETAGLTLGKDLVSDAVAGELLRNPSMVSFLRKYGALKLEKGMTEEQNRLAIQQAVERTVHKGSPAPEEDPKTVQALPEGQRAVEELPLQKDGGDSRIRTEAAAGAKGRKIKRPKLSKIEWRQVQSAQMKKYGALGELEAPESGYVFAHDKFYLIRSYGPGNFEVVGRFDPETQQKMINDILEGKVYGDVEKFGTTRGTADGQYKGNGRGRNSRRTGIGDGGERPGVFPVVQEPGEGSDPPGVLREGGGDLRLDGGAGSGGLRGQEGKAEDEPSQTDRFVSDKMADKLLGDQSSVSFLTRKGGLKLNKKMSQEQKRAAVRQAVENVVHKERFTTGEAGKSGEWDKQEAPEERLESELGNEARWVARSVIAGGEIVRYTGLPKNFREAFLAQLDSAVPVIKELLMREYKNADYVIRTSKRSYHSRRTGQSVIYLGRKAIPSTLAHELFHKIDKGHRISRMLAPGLAQDHEALSTASGGNIKRYLMEKYPEAFTKSRREIPVMHSKYRGIADILNGLSKGQDYYGYGHEESYWRKQGALEAEAWAQLGRILFENDPQVLRMFQDIFPKLFKNGILTLERGN